MFNELYPAALNFQPKTAQHCCRDVKMYQRANNVGVKISYFGSNLCKILRCFVEKVSNVRILRFLVAFFWTFWNFMLLVGIFWTIWVLWAFYADLLQIRFVVIYPLLRVKYFRLKPCLCKKKLFLQVWSRVGKSNFLSTLIFWLYKFGQKNA